MKVSASNGASATNGGARASRTGGDGFAPQQASAARGQGTASSVGGVNALGSLDALLALQETPSATERRRRAIRRAGGLLDALDQVKLSMLDEGGDLQYALDRLRTVARNARDATEDLGLESVLDQVDVRAEVELAKAEMARSASNLAA